MKKYLVVMLLAGGVAAMSTACKKKDDGAKTYTCTCIGATGVTPKPVTGV